MESEYLDISSDKEFQELSKTMSPLNLARFSAMCLYISEKEQFNLTAKSVADMANRIGTTSAHVEELLNAALEQGYLVAGFGIGQVIICRPDAVKARLVLDPDAPGAGKAKRRTH